MVDINPRGIDLVTGQLRPITSTDVPTDIDGELLNGYTGPQGETGFVGASGIEGPQGPTGLLGITGALVVGIRGLTGALGASGLIGLTGLQGRTGSRGITGFQGITGVSGQPGIQGVGNYALLFGDTTIEATIPTGGPYFIGITGGGFTVTLPTAASLGTRELIIQDEIGFSATSPTTIATTGGDTINGAASIALNKNYEAIKLISEGSSLFFARRIVQGITGVQGTTGTSGSTGI